MMKMIMSLCSLRHLALPLLLAGPAAAWADSLTNHIDLVCNAQANIALLRFSISDDSHPTYPRLPQALDHGLSASTGSGRTDCTLANGTTIRVRSGEKQAFAYGMGGGNPPAFFSMWINQHKVFSRQIWMPGYEESFNNPPIYDGVLIAANRITTCTTAEGRSQQCTSQPLDLSLSPIDRVEYPSTTQKPALEPISVIAKGETNQRFCKAYLELIKPGIESALQGNKSSLDIDIASPSTQKKHDASAARSSVIELSPGIERRLMMWQDDSHYFDGTVIALAPSGTTMQNIIDAYPFEDIDAWPKRAAPPEVTLISGGQKQLYPKASPRYVHLVPQRIDQTLYFLAYPTNRELRPTAALVKPLADGGFVTLCAFNRTEPHY